MKTTRFLPLLLLFVLPCFLGAQDIVGAWAITSFTDEAGQPFPATITFQGDGNFSVDMGADGKVDIEGTFTLADGIISITDTNADSPCKGMVGKYRMAVAGDTATATMVSDPCKARGGDGTPMTMKRK
ncbi:MAG: hypothetical protein AAFZ52_12475 [Bacteroidota bacterium]